MGGQWIDATSILGDNNGDNVLTLTITDGGPFDADGQANGIIVDPGGPAVLVVAPTASLPTQTRASVRTPANMSVQYISVSPKQVYANKPVTITTNVVNTGGETGSLSVVLKINDRTEQMKPVSVGPQGTQPVKLTVTKAQPGTYNLDVNGQKSSFTVLSTGGSTGGTSSSNDWIALIVIGALVIAAVMVLLLIFR